MKTSNRPISCTGQKCVRLFCLSICLRKFPEKFAFCRRHCRSWCLEAKSRGCMFSHQSARPAPVPSVDGDKPDRAVHRRFETFSRLERTESRDNDPAFASPFERFLRERVTKLSVRRRLLARHKGLLEMFSVEGLGDRRLRR